MDWSEDLLFFFGTVVCFLFWKGVRFFRRWQDERREEKSYSKDYETWNPPR